MARTYKQQWNKRHGFKLDESQSRSEISKVSRVPNKVIPFGAGPPPRGGRRRSLHGRTVAMMRLLSHSRQRAGSHLEKEKGFVRRDKNPNLTEKP